MYSLPKEKNPINKNIDINKEQYRNIMQADNPLTVEDEKNEEWI